MVKIAYKDSFTKGYSVWKSHSVCRNLLGEEIQIQSENVSPPLGVLPTIRERSERIVGKTYEEWTTVNCEN